MLCSESQLSLYLLETEINLWDAIFQVRDRSVVHTGYSEVRANDLNSPVNFLTAVDGGEGTRLLRAKHRKQ